MEQWRNFFDSSGVDIWTVIERAIGLAANDFPQELRLRRDGFTERMYAPHAAQLKECEDVLPRGSDKTNATSGVYRDEEQEDDDDDDEPQQKQQQQQQRHHRTESDDETRIIHEDLDDEMLEGLTEEMEEERLFVKEIMSIKESIRDIDQPEADVLEQLHTLEDLNISVEALKETEIGKEVNAFRKHPSKRVRALTKKIVRSWKDLVDEWVKSAHDLAVAANGHASLDMGDEEDGLPSPPLDEGALLAARTASLEMSQFFDFMDDDLSAGSGPSPPTSNGLSDDFGSLPDRQRRNDQADRCHSGRNSSSPVQDHDSRGLKGESNIQKAEKFRPVNVENKFDHNSRNGGANNSNVNVESKYDHNPRNGGSNNSNIRKVPSVTNGPPKSSYGSNGSVGSVRPSNGHMPLKQNGGDVRKLDTRPTSSLASNRPKVESTKPGLSTKPKSFEEVSVAEKVEVSKRKLQESYQEANEAKKQRTVQSLELTDLPKGGGPKSARFPQPHQKPGQNRHWANGRR